MVIELPFDIDEHPDLKTALNAIVSAGSIAEVKVEKNDKATVVRIDEILRRLEKIEDR